MAEPHESRVYSDLAIIYDSIFGRMFIDSEHSVIDSLKLRPNQRVLEVGVGTGIALDAYPPYVHVVGIDPSSDMLAVAQKRVRENKLSNVELRPGDALNLDFPDASFDDVTTFHVMTVVPDPVKMMREMIRVCKPGGRIVIINHFGSEKPVLYALVSMFNPITRHLGWTLRLRARHILEGQPIVVERNERLKLSVHRLIVARKA
jgi:phosphatidylethanolamine/phosphatidyl-N-methylethanolamine N-methyltransferase